MVMPQQPPTQPGSNFARLVGEIAQATGAPTEIVAGFLQHMAETLVPQIGPQRFAEQMRQILAQPPDVLAHMLLEFANSPAGASLGQPGGPPGTPVPPPGMPGGPSPAALGPGGPPPQMGGPPPMTGAPVGPAAGPGGPLPARGPRPAAAPGRGAGSGGVGKRKAKPKPRPDRADPWEPDDLPEARYASGPSYATVIAHADEGRRFYADLTTALQEWRDIWHMVEDKEKIDRTQADDKAGSDIVHTRAQPTTMALRIIGMTAPSVERLGIHAPPWDDTDECRESAQRCENAARHWLGEIARLWDRRATVGDLRPPFDRTLAGLATIEGGYGFRVMPNPGRKSFPWDVEPVPMLELFARPAATTRQVECSLGEAYAYEELKDLLPKPQPGESDPVYADDSRVRLITWTDETHYCVACEFCDPQLMKRAQERRPGEYWAVKPREHKLGRRIYLIPNPWNSDPLGPSSSDRFGRSRYLSQGVYAPLVGTIRFVNKMVSALGTGVFKDVHPAKKLKLNPAMREQYSSYFPALTQEMYDQAHQAGGIVVLGPDEDIADIVSNLAASPAGNAFLQSLLGDMGDVAPPVLAGRGAAESGFDRFQASQAAGVLHVDPLINFHVMALCYLLETLLVDVVRLGEGDGAIFRKLPYRQHRAARGGAASLKKAGYMSVLTAKDVRRNGPYLDIKFKRDSLTEQMQLTQLMLLQVKEHLRARVSAMDELGIDDTERERLLMLAEAALEAPDVVKAAIKTALEVQAAEHALEDDGTVNEAALFLGALNEMEERQAMMGGGPQEKGLPGMPSPAGAAPPPMPGSSAGPPPVMTGA